MPFKKTFLLILSFIVITVAKSQTAAEIISRYIEFTGGREAWKKVNTITSSGTYNYGGVEFPFEAFSKKPDLYRYIVTFKGKSFEQAYDGKEGWRIDGFKNEKTKTILKGKQAFAMANESDVELESPLIDYEKKGHTIILEGKDSVDNKPCYRVKFMWKDGGTETLFFNSENFALVKKRAIAKNTELNNAMLDIFYSDYKSTEGITVPFKITCKDNGQPVLDITITGIKLNQPITDSMFKP